MEHTASKHSLKLDDKKPKGKVQSTYVPPSYQPLTDKAFNNWIKYISKKAA